MNYENILKMYLLAGMLFEDIFVVPVSTHIGLHPDVPQILRINKSVSLYILVCAKSEHLPIDRCAAKSGPIIVYSLQYKLQFFR